jgi:DNA end-binding protein Ku
MTLATEIRAFGVHRSAGKPITPKARPAAGNVVDLMEALRRSVDKEAAPAKASKPSKKPRKTAVGPEGNADADRGQEDRQGNAGEKVGVEAAAQVRLVRR